MTSIALVPGVTGKDGSTGRLSDNFLGNRCQPCSYTHYEPAKNNRWANNNELRNSSLLEFRPARSSHWLDFAM